MSTNTFSANRISQADYAAEHLVRDINIASGKIARALADEYAARDGKPRFVAGAIGPTNKTLSLSPDVEDPGYREIDFDELTAVYKEQAAALIEQHTDRAAARDITHQKSGEHGLRITFRPARPEGNEDHFISTAWITVPGAVLADEGARPEDAGRRE